MPHSPKVARELSVSWGVDILAVITKSENLYDTISSIVSTGIESGKLCIEKSYILTAGDPSGKPGTTNTIRILRGEEMSYFK